LFFAVVDGKTGNITINNAIVDYWTQHVYNLTVTVIDSGDPPLNDSVLITVVVNNTGAPPRPTCNKSVQWELREGFDALSLLTLNPSSMLLPLTMLSRLASSAVCSHCALLQILL
jgi:hypothetical protein